MFETNTAVINTDKLENLINYAMLAKFTLTYLKNNSSKTGSIDANPLRVLYGLPQIVYNEITHDFEVKEAL